MVKEKHLNTNINTRIIQKLRKEMFANAKTLVLNKYKCISNRSSTKFEITATPNKGLVLTEFYMDDIINSLTPIYTFKKHINTLDTGRLCKTKSTILFEVNEILTKFETKFEHHNIPRQSYIECKDAVMNFIKSDLIIKPDYNYYLDRQVCTDVVVNTGVELSNECTTTTQNTTKDNLKNLSSLMWLIKQQGVTQAAAIRAIAANENTDKSQDCPAEVKSDNSVFLTSIRKEVLNCKTDKNKLVFLVKMSIRDYISIQSYVKRYNTSETNERPTSRRHRGTIFLDKCVTCGLYNLDTETGSILNIRLKKDVKLPLKYTESISLDKIYTNTCMSMEALIESSWVRDIKSIICVKPCI